jgi:DTW domain-containing protein YfiP
MHPKEYRKTKNGTGHFTHLSLPNSKIFVGIDFTHHDEINTIINDPVNNCFVLYPHQNAIKLNTQNIQENNKRNVIFIIDSTWACSKRIIRESQNLKQLPKISFEHQKASSFKIKTQPNAYCLSTMESTLCILKLLQQHTIETFDDCAIKDFLLPFHKMVEYQVDCAKKIGHVTRYKQPFKNPKEKL